MVSVKRRILLVSNSGEVSPVLHSLVDESELQVVQPANAKRELDRSSLGAYACALVDVDSLGDDAQEWLLQLQAQQPDLQTITFHNSTPTAAASVVARNSARLDMPSATANTRRPVPATSLTFDSHRELHARVSKLTTLYQIGRAISESRNWTEALEFFLATLRDDLELKGAAILLFSQRANVLRARTIVSVSSEDIQTCVQSLLMGYHKDHPSRDIHTLECFQQKNELNCENSSCTHNRLPWRFSVLPLVHRHTPLGFLILHKAHWSSELFVQEQFFLQSIQTILAEEVANAVHLSRLVDLKNFNQTVLGNIQSAVIALRNNGEVEFINRLGRQILGLGENNDEATSLKFEELFRLRDIKDPMAMLLQRLEEHGGSSSFEGLLERHNASSVPIRIRTTEIVNPSDSQRLILLTFEDLSEQKMLEEQARRADRLRSLGELSANIAHEIRNPIQGISLTLSNLKDHVRTAGSQHIDVMFSEIARLDSIVGSILEFARPTPPQLHMESLPDLAKHVIQLARDRAALRDITLELNSKLRVEMCNLDVSQMTQVVLNIVLNAIDASSDGGTVHVQLEEASHALIQKENMPENLSFCHIVVKDHGTGICEEDREKLFDPFFTTKADGTGLGLPISQKIVSGHQGTIHVHSRLGEGSRFIIELPRDTTVCQTYFAESNVVTKTRGA